MSNSFFGSGEGILGVLSKSIAKILAEGSRRGLEPFETGGVDGVIVEVGRLAAIAV